MWDTVNDINHKLLAVTISVSPGNEIRSGKKKKKGEKKRACLNFGNECRYIFAKVCAESNLN